MEWHSAREGVQMGEDTRFPFGVVRGGVPEEPQFGGWMFARARGDVVDVHVLRSAMTAQAAESGADPERELEVVASFSMSGQQFVTTCQRMLEQFGQPPGST